MIDCAGRGIAFTGQYCSRWNLFKGLSEPVRRAPLQTVTGASVATGAKGKANRRTRERF